MSYMLPAARLTKPHICAFANERMVSSNGENGGGRGRIKLENHITLDQADQRGAEASELLQWYNPSTRTEQCKHAL